MTCLISLLFLIKSKSTQSFEGLEKQTISFEDAYEKGEQGRWA